MARRRYAVTINGRGRVVSVTPAHEAPRVRFLNLDIEEAAGLRAGRLELSFDSGNRPLLREVPPEKRGLMPPQPEYPSRIGGSA